MSFSKYVRKKKKEKKHEKKRRRERKGGHGDQNEEIKMENISVTSGILLGDSLIFQQA